MNSSKEERERLLRIISLCLSVERKGSDPFEVQVKTILETLSKYLPRWKAIEDFALDAETLNKISSVVSLQGNWIKHRSTTLFVDPLMIELKVKLLETSKLAVIFRKSWHPIIDMDRLSQKRVGQAVEYWNQLLSLEERFMKLPAPSSTLSFTSIKELVKSRIASEESFNDFLHQFWLELKMRSGEEGGLPYWEFIFASSYEDTVLRAYMTSFLLTYGFATMELNLLDEEAFLIPHMEPKELSLKEQMVSIPISIDYDFWKEIAEGKRND